MPPPSPEEIRRRLRAVKAQQPPSPPSTPKTPALPNPTHDQARIAPNHTIKPTPESDSDETSDSGVHGPAEGQTKPPIVLQLAGLWHACAQWVPDKLVVIGFLLVVTLYFGRTHLPQQRSKPALPAHWEAGRVQLFAQAAANIDISTLSADTVASIQATNVSLELVVTHEVKAATTMYTPVLEPLRKAKARRQDQKTVEDLSHAFGELYRRVGYVLKYYDDSKANLQSALDTVHKDSTAVSTSQSSYLAEASSPRKMSRSYKDPQAPLRSFESQIVKLNEDYAGIEKLIGVVGTGSSKWETYQKEVGWLSDEVQGWENATPSAQQYSELLSRYCAATLAVLGQFEVPQCV